MLNADWHRAHVMPKNATLSQRVAWHREHLRHCGCRPPPQNLLALLDASDKAEAPAHEVSRGEPPPLRELLRGGDRRSVAQSERAHEAPARSASVSRRSDSEDEAPEPTSATARFGSS